jgi:copper chaperone CopZ
MPNEVNLKIDGMHCDACVRRVRMALGKVDGIDVKDVNVGSAHLVIDPAKATPEAAIDAVNGIGFTAQRS